MRGLHCLRVPTCLLIFCWVLQDLMMICSREWILASSSDCRLSFSSICSASYTREVKRDRAQNQKKLTSFFFSSVSEDSDWSREREREIQRKRVSEYRYVRH